MIIDVNANLSRWPFRRVPCDDPQKLVDKLRKCGVREAWAGSLDGLFHKDVRSVNRRLAAECRQAGAGLLRPFGTVNPSLPDWQEDLRRCAEDHHMPGIRLHPNYHGYKLQDAVFAELLARAERCGLIVQLVVRMEDPRMQHPLARVEDVDTSPLAKLVADRPKLRLVLLNALRTLQGDSITALIQAGDVSFEIAMLEGMHGISNLLQRVPVERLLFGSHLPLFILESAVLKLRESPLTVAETEAITYSNAQRLITPSAGQRHRSVKKG